MQGRLISAYLNCSISSLFLPFQIQVSSYLGPLFPSNFSSQHLLPILSFMSQVINYKQQSPSTVLSTEKSHSAKLFYTYNIPAKTSLNFWWELNASL